MKSLVLVGLSFLFIQLSHAEFPVVPDESVTSGDLCSRQDKDFAGFRYSQKIPYCERSVSRGLKARIYQQYGIPKTCRRRFTVDHFYPLSIGGNNSPRNLWPEHHRIKALRQDLEQDVFDAVRENRMSQEEALDRIYEAKMNPPIEELRRLQIQGSDCDRAALQVYEQM